MRGLRKILIWPRDSASSTIYKKEMKKNRYFGLDPFLERTGSIEIFIQNKLATVKGFYCFWERFESVFPSMQSDDWLLWQRTKYVKNSIQWPSLVGPSQIIGVHKISGRYSGWKQFKIIHLFIRQRPFSSTLFLYYISQLSVARVKVCLAKMWRYLTTYPLPIDNSKIPLSGLQSKN